MSTAPRFAIIGNGRLAAHFGFYFDCLQCHYQQWYRGCARSLSSVVSAATHILLLISDDAIVEFVQQHFLNTHHILVHCSGSLTIDGVFAAHPLMTFTSTLYTAEFYPQIPFILCGHDYELSDCLPGLPNPSYHVPTDHWSYYHSLCVMANNFTTILWNKLFTESAQRWQVPTQAIIPFLQQSAINIEVLQDKALTGPLVRQDWDTVRRNLNALEGDTFKEIYKAFVSLYKPITLEVE